MENNMLSGFNDGNAFAAQHDEGEKPEYTRSEVILSVFVMIASFCFIRYVLFHLMGFITTGLFIAIISAAIIYMKKKKYEFSGFNKLLAAVLYIFSMVFSITANNLVKNLDAVFLIGVGAYFVYSVGASNNKIDRFLPYAMFKALLEYPFSHFGTQGKITSDAISSSKKGSEARYILLGLIITVPLTAIVAALLMAADDGLERMLSGIADHIFGNGFWDIVLQLILAIPCSMYLFGLLYANAHRNELNKLNEQACTQKIYNMRFLSNLVVYTAVTPICILYVLFFMSQASYFLSAFTNSLPEGFTYADYARRGFFELCAVAVINLIVTCFISLFSKKAGKEKPLALKVYSVMISVFTLILIATAMSKMVMYISRYGLTALRFYTSWFMVLLAIVFVLIIVKQFRFDMKLSRDISAVFVFMFGLLCFCRPEAVIAKYNIEMYKSGSLEELDTDTLLRMSDDAVLTAYDEGVLTVEEIKEYKLDRIYLVGYGDTLKKYNLSSVILEMKMN
ncbi:DUF4153 domain-containing protein [Ruminococcus sp.]|uniref:DUF4153 domain-containing protein n=1 Tax=Ruminococcus sp. TaxID=41978 RepID=UPI0025EA3742|nr:DUF4173 domain-containing protein [Ruminococcus sp.]